MAQHDNPPQADSFSGKGIFPARMAFTLLFPLRRWIFSPAELLASLDLREDMAVLEVGPGPGYFSIPLMKSLRKGRLILADIQPEMLAIAKRRLDTALVRDGNATHADVAYHRCDGYTFPFPDHSIDRIVLVTVLGEVKHQDEYLHEFHRLLKDDGVLSLTEMVGDPDRLSIATVTALGEATGFGVDRLFKRRLSYTMNMRKK
ncbi:MAG: class I SAM-dependent methyltransferase [Planctomycetaceae bacterium]|nr:class I SAM-dependent methyltransferase [Planctomycetaceae bacterium]